MVTKGLGNSLVNFVVEITIHERGRGYLGDDRCDEPLPDCLRINTGAPLENVNPCLSDNRIVGSTYTAATNPVGSFEGRDDTPRKQII